MSFNDCSTTIIFSATWFVGLLVYWFMIMISPMINAADGK